MRRYDEAIAAARKALSVQADAPVARRALIGALFMKGMYDEVLAVEREIWAKDRELLEALERGYAVGGYADSNRWLADAMAARYGKPDSVSAFTIANRYIHAHDRDRTLEWLEKAYEARDGNVPYIGLLEFDSLRSDPRFQDLWRRVGLPPLKSK